MPLEVTVLFCSISLFLAGFFGVMRQRLKSKWKESLKELDDGSSNLEEVAQQVEELASLYRVATFAAFVFANAAVFIAVYGFLNPL